MVSYATESPLRLNVTVGPEPGFGGGCGAGVTPAITPGLIARPGPEDFGANPRRGQPESAESGLHIGHESLGTAQIDGRVCRQGEPGERFLRQPVAGSAVEDVLVAFREPGHEIVGLVGQW